MTIIEKIFAFGPVFFGVFIFAPMWAAVIAELGLRLPYDLAPLTLTLCLGLILGLAAKIRGRWL